MARIRNLKDFLAGAIFLVIAVTFFFAASSLPQGSAERMGPGYFPVVLSVLLAVVGLFVFARGLIQQDDAPGDFAGRGMLFVVLGALAFAWLVRPAGFLPAIALSVFITTFASPESRILQSIALSLAVAAASWLIFIAGLRLPWAPFGSWFGY